MRKAAMRSTHDPDGMEKAARIALWVLSALALFYLVTEHRAHLFGWLPFLLILACPLMHIFMHRGHHHAYHDRGRDEAHHSAQEHQEGQP
jgi:hypothetical protein